MPTRLKTVSTDKKKPAAPRTRATGGDVSIPSGTRGLIVVESPTKARTISRFLGSEYVVQASMGHVRDLPESGLGYDETTYQPIYETVSDRVDTVRALKSTASRVPEVLIATDPDREGEAIGWHIATLLNLRGPVKRLEFHEITPQAIRQALAQPRTINMSLVDAQQARRVLDRVVGYKLSPLLWRKVARGLSAGRVQSVAVRMICDRDRAIAAFQPQEYWSIDATFSTGIASQPTVLARLSKVDGKKPVIANQSTATEIVALLARQSFRVQSVTTARVKQSAPPPFTTSTLQQAATNQLHWTAKRTMQVAQKLYEGVEIAGEGQIGLITYMRTDSVNLSDSSVAAARTVIESEFGADFVPPTPLRYRTRSKGAQEAHEAIRPTEPARLPQVVASSLTSEQQTLYRLIWRRFMACQMRAAEYDRTTVDVAGSSTGTPPTMLRATASQLAFVGYLAVYGTRPDDAESESEKDASRQQQEKDEREASAANRALPPMAKDQTLSMTGVTPAQHFTEPPPRFNDGSLIKALEAEGIGRPSTYASILSTIQDRGYVEKDGRTLHATPVGNTVTDLLTANFGQIVDTHFTAEMEDQLDQIALGTTAWRDMVAGFADPFVRDLAEKSETLQRVTIQRPPPVTTGEACPDCGKDLVERQGRFGLFISCSGFPTCKYIKKEARATPAPTGLICPQCGSALIERTASRGRGRGKPFYGCSTYPTCTYTQAKVVAEINAEEGPHRP